MKIHRLENRLVLPITLKEAWKFFSTPSNLNELTPKDLQFKIISGAEGKAYAGQIIIYTIKPILNIPLRWVTEITHVSENNYFVDEQKFGPYRFWHHLHRFTEGPEGVIMEDILHYALPYGVIGGIAGKLFLHKKVRNIFEYREKELTRIFPVK
jgi:ligand-binding SRPBCC domain-containing protein